MDLQSQYQEAIKFATAKHLEKGQTIPGTNLPYVVHLSNVAMEVLVAGSLTENFDTGFAVRIALLHDTLEDTDTGYLELEERFGSAVAEAVKALTKDETLPKEERMTDSLRRIRKLSQEVWAVKMADRITNLQPPPAYWNAARRAGYREEAELILSELGGGNQYLAGRLGMKIAEYFNYL
jgi:guanosine-3',5'-bis(diphosphate) 3'-pyrophosphohydrolase